MILCLDTHPSMYQPSMSPRAPQGRCNPLDLVWSVQRQQQPNAGPQVHAGADRPRKEHPRSTTRNATLTGKQGVRCALPQPIVVVTITATDTAKGGILCGSIRAGESPGREGVRSTAATHAIYPPFFGEVFAEHTPKYGFGR